MNIDYKELQAIKRQSLPELLRSYGYDPRSKSNGTFSMLCPFHEDTNPSFSVSLKGETYLWRCFACNIGGTVIDFVMKKENLSLLQTLERLKEKFPAATNGHASFKTNPLELLKNAADFYHKTFFEDKRGLEYLKARGIKSEETCRSFKIGFVDGSFKKTLHRKDQIMALKEFGLLNDSGNEVFYNSVVIPLLGQDGEVVGLYGRNISLKRHLYLKGPHKGLVNRQGAWDTAKVILTESILDALSLYELGVRNVVPCYGTGGFTAHHQTLLEEKRIKEIEVAFDNDKAGETAAVELATRLRGMKIKVSRVKLPERVKDLNDFLDTGGTKEGFGILERIVCEAPESLIQTSSVYAATKDKDALLLKAGDREYRVRLQDEDLNRHMRVNIKLKCGDKRPLLDVLDLCSQRQRKLYSKRVSGEIHAAESEIEEDLYRIIDELEKIQTARQTEGQAQILPMTDEEKEESLKSLKNSDLVHEIVYDLEKIGCVGEGMNKLLGYIVTISRRLDSPLSMIIVSQSGAGKSNLADTLESVLPKEDLVRLSRVSPQALYYMEKDSLKRKVLLIEEKEGSQAADYSIRVLQSKKSLRLAVAMKDPSSGKLRTVIFEVEGPVVVIETTTKSDLNPENASRCFIVYLDESEEQTKRIHAFQRIQKTLEGARMKKESEILMRKHQNMQRLLRPLIVTIPYVEHITFPSKWMRTRRDYAKFLNLIEAVTFLHQYQREIKLNEDGEEFVESVLEDYKLAYEISKEVFGDCLSELMKPEREFLETLKEMTESKNLAVFQRRDVRAFTGLADHVIRQRLRTLEEMEYVMALEGKQGKLYEYRLNPDPAQGREIILGLTTPEELQAKLRNNFAGTLNQSYSLENHRVRPALTL